jgi:hypothetical protein
VIHSGIIGGRIRVRVVCEGGDPAMLTVAISQRLFPGEMQVPADRLVRVSAALLPDTPPGRLSIAFDLAGTGAQSPRSVAEPPLHEGANHPGRRYTTFGSPERCEISPSDSKFVL